MKYVPPPQLLNKIENKTNLFEYRFFHDLVDSTNTDTYLVISFESYIKIENMHTVFQIHATYTKIQMYVIYPYYFTFFNVILRSLENIRYNRIF